MVGGKFQFTTSCLIHELVEAEVQEYQPMTERLRIFPVKQISQNSQVEENQTSSKAND